MPDVPLHTPGDLMSLADVIGRAGVYVGNDSGPTHLAAQLGVPTIALSGPTDPRKWRPRGARVTTLCPPAPTDMDWLDVNVVVEATAAW
jgi:ADP-heptose:LPS heptosyltransferase